MAFLTLTFFLAAAAAGTSAIPQSSSDLMLPISTKEGKARLLDENSLNAPFFSLMPELATQSYWSYCGIATATTVLNAFGDQIRRPIDPLYAPMPYFTQNSIFQNDCVMNITMPALVQGFGTTLDQVADLMRCWGVNANVLRADKMSLEEFRTTLTTAMEKPKTFVTVNLLRTSFNVFGEGHHSPLGGYHASTDSFLVMDVARFRFPPHWVPANVLHKSLSTMDGTVSRGFIIATVD